MAEADPDHGDAASLPARAAGAVRQAEEMLRRAQYSPVPTPRLGVVRGRELDEAVDRLTVIEELLSEDDAARSQVVPALGILRGLRYGILSGSPGQTCCAFRPNPNGRTTDPALDREFALRHLRWADRHLSLTDPMATSARLSLVRLLAPDWLVRAENGGLVEIVAEAARQRAADPDLWEALAVQGRLARAGLPPTTTWRLVSTAQVLSLATSLSAGHGGLAWMGLTGPQRIGALMLFARMAGARDDAQTAVAVRAWIDLLDCLPEGPLDPHFGQQRSDLLSVLEMTVPDAVEEEYPVAGSPPDWKHPDARAARADLASLLDTTATYFGGLHGTTEDERAVGLTGEPSALRWLIAELTSGGDSPPPPEGGSHSVVDEFLRTDQGHHGLWPRDRRRLEQAGRHLREAWEVGDAAGDDPLIAPYLPLARAMRLLHRAWTDPDRDVLDRAAEQARWCLVRGPFLGDPEFHRLMEGALRCDLGVAYVRAALRDEDLSLLRAGTMELGMLRELARHGWGSGVEYTALSRLSFVNALSARLDPEGLDRDLLDAAVDVGYEAMNELAALVLLQPGTERSLAAARAGTMLTLRMADWSHEEDKAAAIVEALEIGRALVLRAAATSSEVPQLLRERGHAELAERWGATASQHSSRADAAEVRPPQPHELRHEAFRALGAFDRFLTKGGRGARHMFGTPSSVLLTSRLADFGGDALVYLIPGTTGAGRGYALLLRSGLVAPEILSLPELTLDAAPLTRYLDAAADRSRRLGTSDEAEAEQGWRDALAALCDWSWSAATGRVLEALSGKGHKKDPRIVLVPCGPLGVVPWHAAHDTGAQRYACQEAVFSYASSGAQLLRSMTRRRMPPAESPVLFAYLDPFWATIEADELHETLYPNARRYGERGYGDPDAPGTGDDLLAVLPGGSRPASIVHLSSHGMAGPSPHRSALFMADGELTVTRILDHVSTASLGDAGPLVVLSACETDLSTRDHDEALTLSTALVTGGAADVVGSRWAIRDSTAAVMMAVFHHFLTVGGHAPADALRAAQLWMLDPHRTPPPTLSGPLAHEATRPDLHQVHSWAAFTHQGNPAPTGWTDPAAPSNVAPAVPPDGVV